MNNKEILEGNKLIAEFMTKEHANLCWKLIPKNTMHLPNYFKYHSSWDWLMPVVNKIESIVDLYHGHFGVYINSNNCTIQSIKFRSDEMTDPPYYFSDHYSESKIESTYNAILNFIKWYNKQNKNKNGK